MFDPKTNLAASVEGLSPKRGGRRVRNWIGGVAVVLLLVAGGSWGIEQFDEILAVAGLNVQKKVVEDKDEMEVFRSMSFLPRPGRVEAPDFLLRTLDGQNRSLQQDRGKIVLLNFWATWCPPCIREMPSMQRLYDKFSDKGLEIVAISVDQGNPDGVRKFAEKMKLNFPIVLDPEQVTKQAYQVRALPTTYLIDRTGRVVAVGMGPREWDGEAASDLIAFLLQEKG